MSVIYIFMKPKEVSKVSLTVCTIQFYFLPTHTS